MKVMVFDGVNPAIQLLTGQCQMAMTDMPMSVKVLNSAGKTTTTIGNVEVVRLFGKHIIIIKPDGCVWSLNRLEYDKLGADELFPFTQVELS